MVNSFNPRPEILWRQVWGLATLVAAIIFSWMIYRLDQPKILQKLEFAPLADYLGILQGLLATVIEPIVGEFSDRIQHRLGSRLPMISVGVTLAGLIFVAVSLLLEQNLQGSIRWVVPVLMTMWVIAMMIFCVPAIALLMQFVPITELPQANAVLVLVFGVIGAIGPLFNMFINSISASMTFLLGAIALMMGAYILRSSTSNHSFNPATISQDIPATTPSILLILIFIVGFGAGLEVNLLMSIFPRELQTQMPSIKLEFITSGIFLVAAIASLPLGEWTAQLGANKAITLGLGTMTGLMGLALLNDNDILVVGFILAFGVSFGLVFVSMIPFVLSKVPPNQAGLSTGLCFGGSAGATALVSLLIKQIGITSMGAFLLAEFAFFVIAGCIMISKKIQVA